MQSIFKCRSRRFSKHSMDNCQKTTLKKRSSSRIQLIRSTVRSQISTHHQRHYLEKLRKNQSQTQSRRARLNHQRLGKYLCLIQEILWSKTQILKTFRSNSRRDLSSPLTNSFRIAVCRHQNRIHQPRIQRQGLG